MLLTITAIPVSGTTWVDPSFPATSRDGLAKDPNRPWQAGPIKDIKISQPVHLTNQFFYFTTNGIPESNKPTSGADFVVGENPIQNVGPGIQPKQVYFFKNFRPGTARGPLLSLGTGIKSPRTYAELLKLLNVSSGVNNLHLDFQYTT
jgi:hypothetical protein